MAQQLFSSIATFGGNGTKDNQSRASSNGQSAGQAAGQVSALGAAPKTWLLGEKFNSVMPHHGGIKELWETKWKFPCTNSLYPFHDGNYEDFEPVFQHLISNNINDGYSDAYTEAFFPFARDLEKQAEAALLDWKTHANGSRLYLRAACLYRIARFPYVASYPTITSESKWKAWEEQKRVYMLAASKFPEPVKEAKVKFLNKKGNDRDIIPVYYRMPTQFMSTRKDIMKDKVPTVLLMTGLDGYRPDNTARLDEFLARGWAAVVVEIPGTADCPADSSDPQSAERLWDAVLTWMQKEGGFDMDKIMVWGLSTGGYYAVRIAYTHANRIKAVVAQGAGIHHFFGREWMAKAAGHEYPFSIWPAMAQKHGYASAEQFLEGAQKKFSLLEDGLLDQPNTRMLLVNGTLDGLMPIEDSLLLFEHGGPKEARFFKDALHMGYPLANNAVYPWMENVIAGK